MKDYKPLPFFSAVSFLTFVSALICGWAPIRDFMQFSYVYTIPRAILAASLMVLTSVFLGVGFILDSQRRYFQDQSQIIRSLRNSQKEEPELRKSA